MTHRLPADSSRSASSSCRNFDSMSPRVLFPDRLVYLVDQIGFGYMHVFIFVF